MAWGRAVEQGAKGLAEQLEKIGFLKELGADRLALPDLPLAGLEHFARRMMSRKPATLASIKDPHRTVEEREASVRQPQQREAQKAGDLDRTFDLAPLQIKPVAG